jgi:hypothetical protein
MNYFFPRLRTLSGGFQSFRPVDLGGGDTVSTVQYLVPAERSE